MPSDLSVIDLATLNAAQGVIVAALRDQCCQWEQQSSDAAAGGHLSNAVFGFPLGMLSALDAAMGFLGLPSLLALAGLVGFVMLRAAFEWFA